MLYSIGNLSLKGDTLCDGFLFPWDAIKVMMKPHSGGLKQFSDFQLNRAQREILCNNKSRDFESYKDKSYTQNILNTTCNWHRVQDDDDTMRRYNNLQDNLSALDHKWDSVGGMITTAECRMRQSMVFWKSGTNKKNRWTTPVHRREASAKYIQNGKYFGKGNLVTHGVMYNMMDDDLFKHCVAVFDRYDINHHVKGWTPNKKYSDPLLYGLTDSDTSDSEDIQSDDNSINLNDSDSNSYPEGISLSKCKDNNELKHDDTNDDDNDELKIDVENISITTKGYVRSDDDDDQLDDTSGNKNSNKNSKKCGVLNKKTSQGKKCVKGKRSVGSKTKLKKKSAKTPKKKLKKRKSKTHNSNSNDLDLSLFNDDNFNGNKFTNGFKDMDFSMGSNVATSKNSLSMDLFEMGNVCPPAKKLKLSKKHRLAKRRPNH